MQIFAKKKKGFTLIELLVVIAIIGILSGIVLVSLSGAQKRARDGRIMTDMAQLRSAAEVFYGTYGSYDTTHAPVSFCNATDTLTLKADIYDQQTVVSDTFNCNASSSKYCIAVPLNSGQWYCVDSSLKSYATNTDLSTNCVSGSDKLDCP